MVEILGSATAAAVLYGAGYLVRSVAWSIKSAGPELRKWRKDRRRALGR